MNEAAGPKGYGYQKLWEDEDLEGYFGGQNQGFLESVAHSVNSMSVMGFAYMLLPTALRSTKMDLREGVNQIQLPGRSDEETLWMNYTPYGSDPPIFAELRGNTPCLLTYKEIDSIRLYVNKECTMFVGGWVVPTAEKSIWLTLAVEACRAFTQKEEIMLAVSAQAACENCVNGYLNDWLSQKGIGKEKRERFLEENATYGVQINVLLRALASPKIPDSLVSVLNQLRDKRNDVAHGRAIPSVERLEMARWLVAMVMLQEYLKRALMSSAG